MKNTKDYSVKNVTAFEGLGFSLSLYRDGKHVAHVDDASGGRYLYDFISRSEKDLFDKMVAAIDEVTETVAGESVTYKPDGDAFIASLLMDEVKRGDRS